MLQYYLEYLFFIFRSHLMIYWFVFHRIDCLQATLNAKSEQLSNGNAKVATLEANLEAIQMKLQQSEEEHHNYRIRAQKILSTKEELIKSRSEVSSERSDEEISRIT